MAPGTRSSSPRRALVFEVLWRTLRSLYEFVPDQDLLPARSRRPNLTGRALRAWTRAPGARAGEGRLAAACAEVCAGRFSDALRRLGREPERCGRASLLAGAALWLRCDRARSRRWLPEALAAAERAVRLLGYRRDALLLRAQIRLELEDNDGGIEDLDRLLEADPGDLSARIGKAETLADMHRYPEALREYAAILRRRPGAWWAIAQRGRLKGVCGRPGPALADLDAARRARPRLGPVRAWRGEALRKLGRIGEARRELDRAIELEPDYAFSWVCRGRLRLGLGDARGALADLDQACRRDPALKLAFAWRGEAFAKLGRPLSAWRDFDRIFPLYPGTTWSSAAGDRGAREAAMFEDLDAAVGRRPRDPAARALRGRLLAHGGRPREALSDLAAALSHRPRRGALRELALPWLKEART